MDALVEVIDRNAATLSEIDGATGDGDHGINMRKGFLLARAQLPEEIGLSGGLTVLGQTLLTRIGGAMGPLYGSLFMAMADACAELERIDAATFGRMLDAGTAVVQELGEARVGDKTLLDTLVPATHAFHGAVDAGRPFKEALAVMTVAAELGKESTRDLVARVGRASRLGERSRGSLDAGATSCWLLLSAMSRSIGELVATDET